MVVVVSFSSDSEPIKRGRPRSEEVERAILKAAAALLEERGFRAFTIGEVALRAKVGKPSIYRRWPSKGTLALDAFLSEYLQLLSPVNTGTLEGDLSASLTAWVQAVEGTPMGRSLVGLIAEAQSDRDLAMSWRERFVTTARSQHRLTIERAIARGEIPSGSDVDVLMDLLYGPAYHRLLNGHLPFSEASVHEVVAVVVAGAKSGDAV
ncbi:MAG TPA: TetR/AcrR family transcriptional regulator [Acidimicrobiales bacterium]